jgi:hypothetical protein
MLNNDNDFALVPRLPSEIGKTEPGARRVLSGMVSETLALVGKKLANKPAHLNACGTARARAKADFFGFGQEGILAAAAEFAKMNCKMN